MACGAGQSGSTAPTGWLQKEAPGGLHYLLSPACLASAGVGVNKDLLKEYEKGHQRPSP